MDLYFPASLPDCLFAFSSSLPAWSLNRSTQLAPLAVKVAAAVAVAALVAVSASASVAVAVSCSLFILAATSFCGIRGDFISTAVYYSFSLSIAAAVSNSFSASVQPSLFPSFSQLQSQASRSSSCRCCCCFFFIIFFLCFCFACFLCCLNLSRITSSFSLAIANCIEPTAAAATWPRKKETVKQREMGWMGQGEERDG